MMSSKGFFNSELTNNNTNGGDDSNDDGSRSSNKNTDSDDDVEQHNDHVRKKYKRHTPQQLQELENLFKESPYPDEKTRIELGMRLNLDSRHIKFWFQNRRTQLKAQIKHYDNSMLREENDKLMAENASIKEAINSPFCPKCSAPLVLNNTAHKELHLQVENARLTDELNRARAIVEKFLDGQLPTSANRNFNP